jgi:hypothetical protein
MRNSDAVLCRRSFNDCTTAVCLSELRIHGSLFRCDTLIMLEQPFSLRRIPYRVGVPRLRGKDCIVTLFDATQP